MDDDHFLHDDERESTRVARDSTHNPKDFGAGRKRNCGTAATRRVRRYTLALARGETGKIGSSRRELGLGVPRRRSSNPLWPWSSRRFRQRSCRSLMPISSAGSILAARQADTSLAKITGHIVCFYEKVKKVKADEGRPGDGSSRARNLSVLKRKRCSQPA